ncbi:DUF2218 domain-containing protein [Roseinatronobacter alkalisoli]|uniref:DUF2218 domain-containing protein n=1 Tax=Roseinatronobacter alkalisoli TaxID=3028235 RepID=A0ABT5TFB9_9RHOB|nr:DUF2218 domain-containing protein [Roseinatronobacter sp. HJB301]MDD7973066.1 DUF2218 domain-containing protein [Roseinatronobacter sp. HJB301]
MQHAICATGRFPTAKASAYLQQLSKHFAHKIPVEFDETTSRITLPTGDCTITASAHELRVDVSADTVEQLDRAKGIVDSHLERFAFREGFKNMAWG